MIFTPPTVGQEVCISTNNGYVFGYTVVKLTPTGRISVQRGTEEPVKFDKYGRQIGGDTWHTYHLELDVAQMRAVVARQRAERAARLAVANVQVKVGEYS